MESYYVEFGKLASEYAKEWGLLAGFELTSRMARHTRIKIKPGFRIIAPGLQIMNRIGGERFGLLFDTGHNALDFKGSNVKGYILKLIAKYLDKIVEFHYGGVNATSKGLMEHRPLDDNDILDNAGMMSLLKRKKYSNPIVFELFFRTGREEQVQASFEENLKIISKAKMKLIELWDKS